MKPDGLNPPGYTPSLFDQETCECGKEPGTFACKVKHIQINTGAAKAARD